MVYSVVKAGLTCAVVGEEQDQTETDVGESLLSLIPGVRGAVACTGAKLLRVNHSSVDLFSPRVMMLHTLEARPRTMLP